MIAAHEHPLDNPVWSSLTTRQAHFSRGDTWARRYLATISPIGALSGSTPAHLSALDDLIEIGDDVALIGPDAPVLPRRWETLYASQLIQMIRRDASPLAEGEIEVSPLDAADVPEILELVALTKPGPFRERTIELGSYIGIRERGRLVAMAGERMWMGEFREVSAVCTHPDLQGRGLARALVGHVVNRMLERGETPILHVDSPNRRAIEMYAGLGFVTRSRLSLLHARRLG